MKKYFVVSDVHSYYTLMMKALHEQGFEDNNPEHIVICCGDLLDRGDESRECLTFMVNMHKANRAWLVRGNHEDLLRNAIRYGCTAIDSYNGTVDTMLQLSGVEYCEAVQAILDNDEELRYYFRNLHNYFETENYIFVHSWIPTMCYTFEEYDPRWREPKADWSGAVWVNPFKEWENGIREPNKTIVCGHYHTSWAHRNLHNLKEDCFDVFKDDGIIGMDACTAYSQKCNCIVLTEEELGCLVE